MWAKHTNVQMFIKHQKTMKIDHLCYKRIWTKSKVFKWLIKHRICDAVCQEY